MVDLHKTDAILQLNGMAYGHEEEKAIYYSIVLSKHGITQAQFDSSLVWYTAHPQLFDKIYPRVLTRPCRGNSARTPNADFHARADG